MNGRQDSILPRYGASDDSGDLEHKSPNSVLSTTTSSVKKILSSFKRSSQMPNESTELTSSRRSSVNTGANGNPVTSSAGPNLLGYTPASDEVDDNLNEANALFHTLESSLGEEWYKNLYAEGVLPERFDFLSGRQWVLASLALYCTFAPAGLYWQGGATKHLDIELPGYTLNGYQFAGVFINALQSYLFSVETIKFFGSGIGNKKVMAATAGVFAAFSTAVFAIATYQTSPDSEDWRIGEAIINASGNYPQFFYGMFMFLQRAIAHLHDNPEARNFVLTKLRETYRNNPLALQLLNAIRRDRLPITKILSDVLGPFASVALTMSGCGYLAATIDYMEGQTNNLGWGITLGIAANFPMLMISMAVTGQYVVDKILEVMEDTYFYLSDKLYNLPRNQLDRRESIYFGVELILILFTLVVSRLTGATSLNLEQTYTPDPLIDDWHGFNNVLEFSSDEFAQVFNFAMAAMALSDIFAYRLQAYVQPRSDKQAEYKVKAMEHATKTISREKIENIAAEAGMSDPVSKRPLSYTEYLFGRKKNDLELYDEESNSPEQTSSYKLTRSITKGG
jgi:hypothetical protein